MSARHQIVLYFDVVSPWSRVAFDVLRRYREKWNVDFDARPINLGYVMKHADNKPPITVTNKGMWMFEDMARASKFYDVTLNQPPSFPVNTFFAQSVLRLIKLEHPNRFEAAVEAMYDAVWTRNDDVTKPEVLGQIVAQAKVLNDEKALRTLIERAYSKEQKAALAEESKQLVLQGGAFGAPWIVVKRKSDGKTAKFFGSDRTEIIAAFLGEEYSGPKANGSTPKL